MAVFFIHSCIFSKRPNSGTNQAYWVVLLIECLLQCLNKRCLFKFPQLTRFLLTAVGYNEILRGFDVKDARQLRMFNSIYEYYKYRNIREYLQILKPEVTNIYLVNSLVQYTVISHRHWAQGAVDDDDDDDDDEQAENTEYFETFPGVEASARRPLCLWSISGDCEIRTVYSCGV